MKQFAILIISLAWCFGRLSAPGQAFTQNDPHGPVAVPAAGGGGGSPAWGGEVQRWSEASATASTVITLTGAVPQGGCVWVMAMIDSKTEAVSGIVDSRGNTYTIQESDAAPLGDTVSLALVTALTATALQIGDTITISYSGSGVSVTRGGTIAYGTSVTAFDQKAKVFNSGTAVSAPASTSSANTVMFGVVWINSVSTITYGSGAWTTSGAADNIFPFTMYFLEHVASSAASQDPSGTLSSGNDWWAAWVAFH